MLPAVACVGRKLIFWFVGADWRLSTAVASCGVSHCFPNFFLADPFWLREITTDPHILADVNIVCPDDRCPELKVYISEVILDRYEYIPVHT